MLLSVINKWNQSLQKLQGKHQCMRSTMLINWIALAELLGMARHDPVSSVHLKANSLKTEMSEQPLPSFSMPGLLLEPHVAKLLLLHISMNYTKLPSTSKSSNK